MGRRSSGWTIVKAIARDIDRANRQHQRLVAAQQRALAVQQRAYEREQERVERQEKKYVEQIMREAARLQDRFNKTLHLSNDSNSVKFKEEKLEEAKAILLQLKNIERDNSFFHLENLSNVEEGIRGVQKELDDLRKHEQHRLSLEEQAIDSTLSALELRDGIENVLPFTLTINDAIDWEGLKDKEPFSMKEPSKPPMPILPPMPHGAKASPQPNILEEKYQPKIPFYLNFLKEKKRLILTQAKQSYEQDLGLWEGEIKRIKLENEKALELWKLEKEALLSARESAYEKSKAEWLKAKSEHQESQKSYNTKIDEQKAEYLSGNKSAIEEYCRLVLSNSKYPFIFAKDYQIEYAPDSRLIALDYQLPSIDVVPRLKEAKFVKNRHEIKETFITDKQHKDIYENLLYAMFLRTIHEIFEADTISSVEAVAMNGWVTSLNKANGHDETKCIMTLNVSKEEFLKVNLANIDLKECFKSLKGIGSARLSDLVPIAPIITLNKNDKRFVQSYDVIADISESDNLALMNWEDFEHLIREIFEKEFCSNGSEVRVTQASRDGGVDAVIYDPDPLRGGKIVIQAKRYTNTVGVSAVRDLYGTIQHEGAMKGILITTSNYGNDAYEFAKGKPLALMNGGNLIHLLEKHGRRARINLAEAKKILQT